MRCALILLVCLLSVPMAFAGPETEEPTSEEIAEAWHAEVDRLARSSARRYNDVSEALSYAETKMHNDVIAALAKKFEISQARAVQLFEAREVPEHPKKARVAEGTWLVRDGVDGGDAGVGDDHIDEPEDPAVEDAEREADTEKAPVVADPEEEDEAGAVFVMLQVDDKVAVIPVDRTVTRETLVTTPNAISVTVLDASGDPNSARQGWLYPGRNDKEDVVQLRGIDTGIPGGYAPIDWGQVHDDSKEVPDDKDDDPSGESTNGGVNEPVKKPLRIRFAKLKDSADWWKSARDSLRAEILTAIYATEHLRTVEEDTRQCKKCGGSGTMNSSAGREVYCDRCHGVGYDLTLVYY